MFLTAPNRESCTIKHYYSRLKLCILNSSLFSANSVSFLEEVKNFKFQMVFSWRHYNAVFHSVQHFSFCVLKLKAVNKSGKWRIRNALRNINSIEILKWATNGYVTLMSLGTSTFVENCEEVGYEVRLSGHSKYSPSPAEWSDNFYPPNHFIPPIIVIKQQGADYDFMGLL